MAIETAPINMANYPVMHKHNITESEFPTIERQYDPFRGFELVFVDPLDVTVRYWWPAMVSSRILEKEPLVSLAIY
jgi:hypothetical protein